MSDFILNQSSAFLYTPCCSTLNSYFTLQYFNSPENIYIVHALTAVLVYASQNDTRQNIDLYIFFFFLPLIKISFIIYKSNVLKSKIFTIV